MSSRVAKRPVVLVVENDFLLRMDAINIVRDAGSRRSRPRTPMTRLRLIEADPNIHVVFTDMQMPGTMDGLKLARFIKDRWPPIKIVATSGRLKVSENDLPEGSIFVPKPTPRRKSSARFAN